METVYKYHPIKWNKPREKEIQEENMKQGEKQGKKERRKKEKKNSWALILDSWN